MHKLRSDREQLSRFIRGHREAAGFVTRKEFSKKKGVSLNTLNWLELVGYRKVKVPTETSVIRVVGTFRLDRTIRKYIVGLAKKVLKEASN